MNKKQKQHKTVMPGQALGVHVLGPGRDDLSFALKIWKSKVKSSKILEMVKDQKTYTKPSVARRSTLISAKYMQYVKDLHRD
jgi:ribosomal protein S21